MKGALRVVIALCAAAGFAIGAGPEAEARCAFTSAQAEGLTKGLAQGMAKINLDFAIAFKGEKGAGPVRYRCAPGTLGLTSCTARQRSCT